MSARGFLDNPGVRRLIGLALLCGLILIGGRLFLARPTTLEVVYELGPAAAELRGLVVSYRPLPAEDAQPRSGLIALRKRYNYGAKGAPENELHRVRLKPGRYQLEAALERGSDTTTVTRTVEVGAEDATLRINLRP